MSVHVTLQEYSRTDFFTDNHEAEAEEALAALVDINTRYERERDGLRRWIGPEHAKERLLAGLQERMNADREPVVKRLRQLRHQTKRFG